MSKMFLTNFLDLINSVDAATVWIIAAALMLAIAWMLATARILSTLWMQVTAWVLTTAWMPATDKLYQHHGF
jgi:hypothetical protein